jgi:hypothetical protein
MKALSAFIPLSCDKNSFHSEFKPKEFGHNVVMT